MTSSLILNEGGSDPPFFVFSAQCPISSGELERRRMLRLVQTQFAATGQMN